MVKGQERADLEKYDFRVFALVAREDCFTILFKSVIEFRREAIILWSVADSFYNQLNMYDIFIGSPCATLFITILVLRLLTENRCDSISYQRACGPRQAGNPDNTISSFTLPKGVPQVES